MLDSLDAVARHSARGVLVYSNKPRKKPMVSCVPAIKPSYMLEPSKRTIDQLVAPTHIDRQYMPIEIGTNARRSANLTP